MERIVKKSSEEIGDPCFPGLSHPVHTTLQGDFSSEDPGLDNTKSALS